MLRFIRILTDQEHNKDNFPTEYLTHPGRRPILSEITEDPLFFRCILKAMKIIEFELCQLLLTVDVSGLPRVIDFSAGKRKLRFCICSDSFVYLL
jgi:hypothetical protein